MSLKLSIFHIITKFLLTSSLFIFSNQLLTHKEDGISKTGKLNKVYKMVEGMSFLCHECVGLRLDDFHFLNMFSGQGGVQQSPESKVCVNLSPIYNHIYRENTEANILKFCPAVTCNLQTKNDVLRTRQASAAVS